MRNRNNQVKLGQLNLSLLQTNEVTSQKHHILNIMTLNLTMATGAREEYKTQLQN